MAVSSSMSPSLDDEDAEDVAIYDACKADLAAGRDAALPSEVSAAMLKGDSLLRALRRWRRVSQSTVAAAAKIGQGHLSDLEARRRTGSAETLAAIAAALDVPREWLA
jgi:predicted transcriptional regulator